MLSKKALKTFLINRTILRLIKAIFLSHYTKNIRIDNKEETPHQHPIQMSHITKQKHQKILISNKTVGLKNNLVKEIFLKRYQAAQKFLQIRLLRFVRIM